MSVSFLVGVNVPRSSQSRVKLPLSVPQMVGVAVADEAVAVMRVEVKLAVIGVDEMAELLSKGELLLASTLDVKLRVAGAELEAGVALSGADNAKGWLEMESTPEPVALGETLATVPVPIGTLCDNDPELEALSVAGMLEAAVGGSETKRKLVVD